MKALLALFILLGSSLLNAADGGVHGRVYGQDESGENLGPLANAKIELRSETGDAAATTVTTNESGYYQIATLTAGAYRYKVTVAGFRDEDEMRGFAMPQDTREYVHDFLLTRESKPGSRPALSNRVQPAVHGRVYGQTLKGENLGPVANAKIELRTEAGTAAAVVTTNESGYYQIAPLAVGAYRYKVTAASFRNEDELRGFAVPPDAREFVHDFLLTRESKPDSRVPQSNMVQPAVHGRVYGQTETGENLGPLANAKIELRKETGEAAASVTTNEFGYYQIAPLAVGAYRYKVTAASFRDEDETRGFAVPPDTREYVHDFLLTREPKPGTTLTQSNSVLPAVHGRVYGQTEKGENLGPLPGATVELLSSQGGTVVATATASSPGGYYEIKDLPPADYAYRVTATGFATEDAGRGFNVPQGSLEYVHDFILSKTPPKRYKCDLAMLVVKLISSGKDRANDARLPVASARIVLQPAGNIPAPLNQPFMTDAKGEFMAQDLAEGSYTVAIDAPECEPFTGALEVKCDKDGDVIFVLQPCNELLHGYVRAMLNEGWGGLATAKAAAERAYLRAMKVDAKDCSVNYACGLALLSAGDYSAAQQSLAAAIGKKSDNTTWDRACEARLWMNLCQHQPEQAMREMRSLAQNHYSTRVATQAAKDTAHVCGIGLGLMRGPWQEQVRAGDAVVLESDLLAAFKGDLRIACIKARDYVLVEYGKMKAAEDAARNQLIVVVTEKRNIEIVRIVERQTIITQEVAVLDPEIQALQATVNQYEQQYRIQITGFMQQRQGLLVQLQTMNARLQQITNCMAQDQVNLQATAQQMPTMQPGMRPGMMQPGGGSQAILVEIQQHQLEIQQIRQQMVLIQNQDAQMAVSIVNLQTQCKRSSGTAQAELEIKLRRREVLVVEYETLERQRTTVIDFRTYSTPEIDDLMRRKRSLKTYCDLPLELRREEVLEQFDCGAAKEPKRFVNAVQPVQIIEPVFSMKPPVSNAPAATQPSMPAQPVPENSGMPPLKPLPAAATAVKPPPNMGDPAEVVVTNNHTGAMRIFSLTPGADNELFVRSLEAGEESMIPARIGQTLIIRASAGGRELQRQKVGKKLEILKVGTAPPQQQ